MNATRPVGPVMKSGMTAAGIAEREKELAREREQREREQRGENMDVDEAESKAKNRRFVLYTFYTFDDSGSCLTQ